MYGTIKTQVTQDISLLIVLTKLFPSHQCMSVFSHAMIDFLNHPYFCIIFRIYKKQHLTFNLESSTKSRWKSAYYN